MTDDPLTRMLLELQSTSELTADLIKITEDLENAKEKIIALYPNGDAEAFDKINAEYNQFSLAIADIMKDGNEYCLQATLHSLCDCNLQTIRFFIEQINGLKQ